MFMKNKSILTLLFSITFSVLLVSCNNSDTPTSGENDNLNETLTLEVMRSEHPNQPLDNESPVIEEILNKTGVKIVLNPVPGSDYEDRKNIALGTNNIPDVLSIQQNDVNNHASTGIFLSITEYMEHAPNLQKLIEEYPEINRIKVDGELYHFPTLGKWKVDAGQVTMIRIDLLKEVGLDYPRDFYELYEVLKAIKEAYPDMYPLTNRNGTSYFLDTIAFPLGSGNQIYYDPDIEEGKYVYGPAREEFKEVVKYLNRLFEENLLDPDYAVNNAQMWQEKLSSGKSAFFFDNNTFAVNFNRALKDIDENARFDLIPLMENSFGQTRAYKFHQHWLQEGYAISSEVENPIE